jgi:hypothetical protein
LYAEDLNNITTDLNNITADLNNITTEIENLQDNTETLENKIETLGKFKNIEGTGYLYMNSEPPEDIPESGDTPKFPRSQYSSTLGYRNQAMLRGHAEGDTTLAKWRSHSEGYMTEAIGSNSHAEGGGALASGKGSHAEGFNSA